MNTDSCSSVREAALECICINKITLPAIMLHLRDVTASVRAIARTKMMRVVEAGAAANETCVSDSMDDSQMMNSTTSDINATMISVGDE